MRVLARILMPFAAGARDVNLRQSAPFARGLPPSVAFVVPGTTAALVAVALEAGLAFGRTAQASRPTGRSGRVR